MPSPFVRLSSADFGSLLSRFPFRRRIDAVHLHHTWRPRHQDYRQRDTIVAMANHHMQVNGWSDIAQHVTIGPEGAIWTGRDWNRPPASSTGYNGNRQSGPFMIEMIGDFDAGRDRLEGEQRQAAIDVIARVQMQFGLPPESLRFHNTMSSKTCPGTSVDHGEIVAEVAERQRKLQNARRAPRAAEATGFGDDAAFYFDFIESCVRSRGLQDEAGVAEPAEQSMSADEQRRYDAYGGRIAAAPARGRAAERGPASKLTPDVVRGLRPHVVNMSQGRFSSSGLYASTPADVATIFNEHLPRAHAEAKAKGQPLRLVFYAHGGLVNEAGGLWMAARLIPWWRANGIYPIYFVWETGLLETLGQLLKGAKGRALRGGRDLADVTSDPVLEQLARALRGDLIWGGMKLSAERAAAPGGAARHVAERLKAFCDAHGDGVELHAVGHSAGSIFHAHFIPAALDVGAPRFASASFLAPAIRVDTFLDQLAPRLDDGGVKRLDIFTMAKDWERADQCMSIYRKSLLYLVSNALEPERKEPILGLEESLRESPRLRALFGLDGGAGAKGEVIWSKTVVSDGDSATCSTSHGGFDNDAPTMSSVVRRILGGGPGGPGAAVQAFPAEAAADRGSSLWPEDILFVDDELEFLNASMAGETNGHAPMATSSTATPPAAAGEPDAATSRLQHTGGRRRALCIGIDEYPDAPLGGCVADAKAWSQALQAQKFECKELVNDQATRTAIAEEIRTLFQSSVAGDVVVVQYSGHGTQLPDLDGDETSDGQDEAICPFDYANGAFIVDDEMANLFERIPAGVNVTCFFDCCHSGTIARFAVGAPTGRKNGKVRYLKATPEMIKAYRGYRKSTRGIAAARVPDHARRAVVYSACKATEVAWEHDGHGDFTSHAVPMLESNLGRTNNERFQELIQQAFGAEPQQHPQLDCRPEQEGWALLSQIAPTATDPSVPFGAIPALHTS